MQRSGNLPDPKNGDIFDLDLDLNNGTFDITHFQTGLHANTKDMSGRRVRPFVGVYYPKSTISMELI